MNQTRKPPSVQRWLSSFAIALVAVIVCNSTAIAQSANPDVHAKIQELQSQIDQLKTYYHTEDLTVEEGGEIQPAGYFSSPQSGPACSPLTQEKSYPTARLTGFFQADAAWIHQEPLNRAAVGDIPDGADFRRARLAAVGEAWDNVNYMLEMDFAFPGRPSFMDVWLQGTDIAGGNVRIGQYRQPFGMDGQTSVKELTFFERGLPFAFLPFRQIGGMYNTVSEDERTTWAIAGFRYPTDPYGGNLGDSGGFGTVTRLTTLVIDNGDDGVLHLGAGYSYIDPSINLIRFRTQPELSTAYTGGEPLIPNLELSAVPVFVDTGPIPSHNLNLFNVELGASSGPFHAQTEYFIATVDQLNGPQLAFEGAYAHFGYILTGESRPYNRKAGVFGRIVPDNPVGPQRLGAWEVAGRWSFIDLNDENVQGGRLTDFTVGLNWYWNKHTKFQFNYIHAFLESSSAFGGLGGPVPVIDDSNADIFAIRAQVDF